MCRTNLTGAKSGNYRVPMLTPDIQILVLVRLHCPTPRQTQITHRTKWEPALMSVSVRNEHLHTFRSRCRVV